MRLVESFDGWIKEAQKLNVRVKRFHESNSRRFQCGQVRNSKDLNDGLRDER